MYFTDNQENRSTKMKAIETQSFSRGKATVYVVDTPITAAFSVRGELCVIATSKLGKAERTRQIREVIDGYRRRSGEVGNA